MRTNLSLAEMAQAVHMAADTVPTRDNNRGMYWTDFVSITVLTTVKGAAYIIIFDITAKNPRNLDGDDDMKDIPIAALVIADG